ncbi:TIGR03118 family protein [Pseudoduganella sp. UC29_106]|uniref:TIGR03118 family protein n=1 Tax=Pseudoduganella sp. UC29_106 TaxID=3374553 RepID=UPI003757B883
MELRPFSARMFAAGIAATIAGAILAACGGGHHDHNMPPYTPPTMQQPMVLANFKTTSLVADTSTAGAANTDAKLINAWGIAFDPTGFVWVVNNGTATSTLYDGNGVPQTLVVATPPGPTGIIFNGSQDFKITQNGVTAASPFVFASESGMIAAWSPSVNRTATVTVFDGSSANKVYKGLAAASYLGLNYLYAADFHNNAIDVFDRNFAPAVLPGQFKTPGLPAGYAPFNVQAIGDRIYVAYAKRETTGDDEDAGPGLGSISVFDTGGNYIRQLTSGGALNAPWGMVMAPANFGAASNMLLVANFGDGKINAYNPNTGAFAGALARADGTPIVIAGLWGLAFGPGVNSQPTNTLFFTAGPGDEKHGQYGRIDMQ